MALRLYYFYRASKTIRFVYNQSKLTTNQEINQKEEQCLGKIS
jgi:hypothetical protein